MLIDDYLPLFDVTEVQEVVVDAPADVTYAAIREADIRDPVIRVLFAVRELRTRLARRLRGEAPPPPPARFTFADLATPEMGWVPLAEDPGAEFVVGAVGKFWKHDYGWKPVAPADFAAFDEPGYARLAVGFSVRPRGHDRAVLHYEARTMATDPVARKHFRRYWAVIHPGVAVVMRRALARIRDEAERRHAAMPVGAA